MSGLVIRVVGAGQIGAAHIRSFIPAPYVEKILVNDTDGAAVVKALVWGDKVRIDDPACKADLTIIGTQAHQHWPVARHYIDRGEPIYVEKPLSLDLDEARQFIAAEDTGAWICVGQNMRLMAAPVALHRLGNVGIRLLTLHKYRLRGARDPDPLYGAAYYKTRGRFDYDGGVMAQQAQHLFDLAVHLLGPAMSVYCAGRTFEHKIECEDTATATLDHGHCFSNLLGTTAAHGGVFGEHPTAENTFLTVAARDGNACVQGYQLDKANWWTFGKTFDELSGYAPSLKSLAISAIIEGWESPLPPSHVIHGLEALHAAYRSMDSGRPEVPGEAHPLLGRPALREAA